MNHDAFCGINGGPCDCPDKATVKADPFNCAGPGCHDGSFASFDHFCDALDVTPEETPLAFGAWLGHRVNWDGRMGPVAE